MRTTVNLDDDVLGVTRELAALSGRTLGEVLSDLVRQGLARQAEEGAMRNGVPLLEPTPDARIVSSEDVARLVDDA
ncbi:MAG: CopG family transcriptional regulator [Gemmatimonadota bacterium]